MTNSPSQYSSETALTIKQINRRGNFGSEPHSFEGETPSKILLPFEGKNKIKVKNFNVHKI
jgi:hypothetical protein